MSTFKLTVTGQVQGVFFRENSKKEAEKLFLQGYVRNLDNGNVEIIVQGKKEKIDEFIVWCYRGSDDAVVENVSSEEIKTDVKISQFKIKY